ncbi:hypothetical protein OC834_004274 [Tilletia horrida]|nr:hypothetical protein OC834_004274 [Tilletia horrida]
MDAASAQLPQQQHPHSSTASAPAARSQPQAARVPATRTAAAIRHAAAVAAATAAAAVPSGSNDGENSGPASSIRASRVLVPSTGPLPPPISVLATSSPTKPRTGLSNLSLGLRPIKPLSFAGSTSSSSSSSSSSNKENDGARQEPAARKLLDSSRLRIRSNNPLQPQGQPRAPGTKKADTSAGGKMTAAFVSQEKVYAPASSAAAANPIGPAPAPASEKNAAPAPSAPAKAKSEVFVPPTSKLKPPGKQVAGTAQSKLPRPASAHPSSLPSLPRPTKQHSVTSSLPKASHPIPRKLRNSPPSAASSSKAAPKAATLSSRYGGTRLKARASLTATSTRMKVTMQTMAAAAAAAALRASAAQNAVDSNAAPVRESVNPAPLATAEVAVVQKQSGPSEGPIASAKTAQPQPLSASESTSTSLAEVLQQSTHEPEKPTSTTSTTTTTTTAAPSTSAPVSEPLPAQSAIKRPSPVLGTTALPSMIPMPSSRIARPHSPPNRSLLTAPTCPKPKPQSQDPPAPPPIPLQHKSYPPALNITPKELSRLTALHTRRNEVQAVKVRFKTVRVEGRRRPPSPTSRIRRVGEPVPGLEGGPAEEEDGEEVEVEAEAERLVESGGKESPLGSEEADEEEEDGAEGGEGDMPISDPLEPSSATSSAITVQGRSASASATTRPPLPTSQRVLRSATSSPPSSSASSPAAPLHSSVTPAKRRVRWDDVPRKAKRCVPPSYRAQAQPQEGQTQKQGQAVPTGKGAGVIVGKSCIAPTTHAIKLDALGNAPDADRPFPLQAQLRRTKVLVKRYIYDGEDVDADAGGDMEGEAAEEEPPSSGGPLEEGVLVDVGLLPSQGPATTQTVGMGLGLSLVPASASGPTLRRTLNSGGAGR